MEMTKPEHFSPRQDGAQRRVRILAREYGVVLLAAVLVLAVQVGNPAFLSFGNFANLLSQWAPAGLISIGMTYVVISGGFDLSVAATFSFCSVIAAAAAGEYSPTFAFALALIAGGAIGLINGFIVARFKVNPFAATLGTGFVVTGITFVFSQNAAFVVANPAFAILGAGRLMGVPYSGMVLVLSMLIASFVLSRTIYGTVLYAVGGNIEASRLSGINVPLVIGGTYVLLGVATGLAGYISASQLSSAQANMDPNILFDVFTIVIVGGTPLGGGAGAVWRTVVGIIIIAAITNGFVLLDINPFYQNIIKGLIIVVALIVDTGLRRSAL
jgi:ribose transport system permease protein